jgi:MFS family permease
MAIRTATRTARAATRRRRHQALPTAAARIIRLNSGFNFFFGLLWWLPIFYEYQRGVGLSDAQIFGIQSIYYVAFCLLEIPTGMLADRFDYRRSMLAGSVVLMAANALPPLMPSYSGFLWHFLLIALARSLISGACSAYLYEYLQRTGAGHVYRQAEGRARAYSLIGRVVCWPIVGVLMQWHLSMPYWLSVASAAAAVVVALRLPALPALPVGQPSGGGQGGPGGGPSARAADRLRVWAVLRTLRGSRVLILVMVQGVAIFTLVRICQVNLAQPILAGKHLPLAAFGVVLAAMTVAETGGAVLSGRLRHRLAGGRAVSALTVVMAASLGLLVTVGAAGTVLLMCVFSLASGLSYPVQRQLLNDAVPVAGQRATLLSAESLIDRAVCAVVVLALGRYLSRGALDAFLVHTAVATCALMVVVAVALRRATRAAARSLTPSLE